MALDGIVIYSLINEYKDKLIGGKIDKIYQPENDEIILNIRCDKTSYKLLLSANSSNPRSYLCSSYKKENPLSAPMFCMLLRKHIQSGRITNIDQPNFERIIKITIESFDELKQQTKKDLIIEIMGRHSNIILIDTDKNTIIDSIKRINLNVSSYRQVLPGRQYISPPSQNKLNPLDEISLCQFENSLDRNIPIFKSIYMKFKGISPILAKEICFKSKICENDTLLDLSSSDFENLYKSFTKLFNQIKNNIFYPCIVIDKRLDKIIDFCSIKLTMYSDLSYIENDSISYIMEKFYYEKDFKERVHQKSYSLKKSISTKLDRLYNKIKKQEIELLESQNNDKYLIFGNLITANMYTISQGMESIDVINYFDEKNEMINIKLDKNISPSLNAQRYFKKYNKLKHANIELTTQMQITKEEIDYLENIILSINNCEEICELDEIKEELVKQGYAKDKTISKKNKNISLKTKPYEFLSSDNFTIYVGKNNKQNDYITLKMASADDVWLHTKDIPGSHVIIKSNSNIIPQTTLYEAGILAAYFSKARLSSNVPVDYTNRKNIKKPNGAKPGMVIYETNNTIYVTPNEEDVVKIKNNIDNNSL